MTLPEDFLHYLWQFRLFEQRNLQTVSGEKVQVIHVGVHNQHAGPDFENSLIRIGDTLWAGNVEIHLQSSDWLRHKHQFDRGYDNVILHVVGCHDREIVRTDGTPIPVLDIGNRVPERLADNYFRLIECLDWIPCGNQLSKIEDIYLQTWLYRVEIERLESKSEQVIVLLNECKGSWDDSFHLALARNFGFKTNSIPFEMLARSLSRQLLGRYRNEPRKIEALLFGQSGLLERAKDDYPRDLHNEYTFLRKKHHLQPIDGYLWKYMRLRPRNFPTVRLAQFAALMLRSDHLFSIILEEQRVEKIVNLFESLPVNEYWNTHNRFDAECIYSSSSLGEQALGNLLINTVTPFLMAYGRYAGSQEHIARSVDLLENVKPEINAVTDRFKKIGVSAASAFFSQSLIQLKKSYCDQKKCLSCGIGIKLLNV